MMPPIATPPRIALALSGASGMPYALRLLSCLLQAECTVWLMYSSASQLVLQEECGLVLPEESEAAEVFLQQKFGVSSARLRVFGAQQWFSPPASGSNPPDAMVVCPCSMGTLAAIAHGLSSNLSERAASVVIKEKRPLILVPRETPLSALHLENMLKLAQLNVTILPPCPGFYWKPQSVDDLVDFVVARILDQLKIPHQLVRRWADTDGDTSLS